MRTDKPWYINQLVNIDSLGMSERFHWNRPLSFTKELSMIRCDYN